MASNEHDISSMMEKWVMIPEDDEGVYNTEIYIDHEHFIWITDLYNAGGMPSQPGWYVFFECDYNGGTRYKYPTMFKARKAAFELVNVKCEFCYDEEGNRRRN